MGNVTVSTTCVVLLNHNGWRDTLPCLFALRELEGQHPQVIVVDNGSEDGSVDRIREAEPGCTLLIAGQNLGFAAGANLGIERALAAGADFVWLLNNDTVPGPNSLSALLQAMASDPSLGMVGSNLRYAHDPAMPQALGGGYIRWWLGVPQAVRRQRQLSKLEYVNGASMLVRAAVFEEVGLFDECFFLYWEDVDLCRRAQHAGWRLGAALDSVVLHKEGGTARRGALRNSLFMDVHHLRSLSCFMRKHYRAWPFPLLVRGLLEVPNQIRYGTPGRLPAMWRAMLEGATRRSWRTGVQ